MTPDAVNHWLTVDFITTFITTACLFGMASTALLSLALGRTAAGNLRESPSGSDTAAEIGRY